MVFIGGGFKGGELGYKRKCVLEGRGQDVKITFLEPEEGTGGPCGVGGGGGGGLARDAKLK